MMSSLAVLGAVGCEDADVSSEGVGPDQDVVRVSGEPVLAIGVMDGPPEEEFGSVGEVAVYGDSVLGVLDQQAHEARFFDLEGEFVDEMGGRGEGPGEMQGRATWTWVDGDGALTMYDDGPEEVVAYRPDGTFDDTVVPDPGIQFPEVFFAQGRAFGAWVGLFETMAEEFPSEGDTERTSVELRVLADEEFTDGGRIEMPGPRSYTTAAGQPTMLPPPLEPVPRVTATWNVAAALDPMNARVFLLADNLTWHEVELEDRCPEVPQTYLEDSEEGEELRREVPIPEFRDLVPECLSPYDRLAVTGDGRAWVRLTVGGDEEPEKHRWAVVEGPDEPVRIAELPADFVPMDARDGIVYGRWTDPYGVHHVRAYHLSEAAEGGSAP